MSMIEIFKNDLAANEAARKSAHAQIDVVHDEIKKAIEGGINSFQNFFAPTPAPVATVEKVAPVAVATAEPVAVNGVPVPTDPVVTGEVPQS